MQVKAVFISAAHLGINPEGCFPEREKLLLEVLESLVDNCSHLVIAGDLFEFWYEYRYYVTRSHIDLFSALLRLVKHGTKVHILTGNHDFAYGDFFPSTLGVNVHKSLILDLDGTRIFVSHGDGVAKSDRGYRFLRKVLDFPLNRKLFSLLHPDIGMSIARFVGRNSRKIGESRKIRLDEYLEWGKSTLEVNQCSLCIHGHHHIAGIWDVEGGKVASPGEWIWNPAYLKFEDGKLSLHKIERGTQELTP